MAQNITLLGASYSAVPAVTLPKTGGGTASFTDVSDTTATAADVASGTYFYTAAGERTEGTASGGGGGGTEYIIAQSTHPILNMKGFDLTSVGLTASDILLDGNTLIWIEATTTFSITCWLDFDDDNDFSISIPVGTKFTCADVKDSTYSVSASFVGKTLNTYGFFNMSADKSDDFFIYESGGDNAASGGFVRSLSYKAQNGVPAMSYHSVSFELHIVKFS